ncbi:ABC transporter permease subunit [Octadecabacter sp. 1_MG-2023]|uniref:ABC transporter permease n=1 Tax=unclassified Octadecabacter TaxID=196158 RepID=UPI001C08DE1F|nr:MULTISPECIES: ABC transporter permease subunit [unclassified Octadecabacter]MBU2991880.1 ABC transporter permease subunit [Octadecabacter sp. B2R22]MDO6735854.1 ABC transporter permease subunit [Octadecabacter sp. 1_MG-2023]
MDVIFEYKQILIEGTLVTISLAVLSLLLSIALGLMGAFAKLSPKRGVRRAGELYTLFVRSVPDLVLMMLIFYGGQTLMSQIGALTGLWGYIDINQFIAGVLTLGFIFGAYMSETFRGAILAVPSGQIEAAKAVGMTPSQVFRIVTWPQMVRFALPSFTNNWLVLVKSTALVSVIGLHDLVWNAFTAGRSTHMLFSFMIAVMVIYLIITGLSDVILRAVDRKYAAGVRKA